MSRFSKKWFDYQKFAVGVIFRYIHDSKYKGPSHKGYFKSYYEYFWGSVSHSKESKIVYIDFHFEHSNDIDVYLQDESLHNLIKILQSDIRVIKKQNTYYEIPRVIPLWLKLSIPSTYKKENLIFDQESYDILYEYHNKVCPVLHDKLVDLDNDPENLILVELKKNNECIYKVIKYLYGIPNFIKDYC